MTSFQGKLLLALTMLVSSQAGFADLIVNRSIMVFDDPIENKQDVVVFNSDELNNLYLRVDPYMVENPGEPDQELVSLQPGESPDFLASPNRLIVPPGSRSLIRMLNLGAPSAEERVYRVNLIPVSAPPELATEGNDTVRSRLDIVVAYQVLAIVLPLEPEPVVNYSRSGNTVTFSNPGNTNYLITDSFQCNPFAMDECVELVDKRIYPGNTWEMELPFNGSATFKIRTNEGHRTLIVD